MWTILRLADAKMRLASSIIAAVCWAAAGCVGLTQPSADGTTTAPSAPKTLLRWSSSEQATYNEKDAGGKEPTESPAADDSITTDRPTFTPSSRAVGKGHVQLETGYTFTAGQNGIPTTSH